MNDNIDALIEQSIDALANDSPSLAAKALQELSYIFARAGCSQKSFTDLRQYIVNEASALTSAGFVLEKLKVAERDLAIDRIKKANSPGVAERNSSNAEAAAKVD